MRGPDRCGCACFEIVFALWIKYLCRTRWRAGKGRKACEREKESGGGSERKTERKSETRVRERREREGVAGASERERQKIPSGSVRE